MRHATVADSPVGCAPGDHLCWVYRDENDWIDAASRYLSEGALLNDQLLYVADKPASELIDDLAQLPGRDAMLESGQLQVLPLFDCHPVMDGDPVAGGMQTGAYRARAQAAADSGFRALRLAADASELALTADLGRGFATYELLVDSMIAQSPMTALCGYDARRVDLAAARVLSFVHPSCNHGDHRPNASLHADEHGRWRLTGEVDLAGLAELEVALTAVPADRDLHLGVEALGFIDVAGVRALISLARRLGPDRRLVVHEPPQTLRRILDLGWPERPESLMLR
ncbi:MAG: MEDS domain-containing protein [Solirubrobacteraceae bacterium]